MTAHTKTSAAVTSQFNYGWCQKTSNKWRNDTRVV